MFDARAHRGSRFLPCHDGRRPWPITIATGDHQNIVLIDRLGLKCDHSFAGRWHTDVGDIDGFDDLGRIAERLDLDYFHGCSLQNIRFQADGTWKCGAEVWVHDILKPAQDAARPP